MNFDGGYGIEKATEASGSQALLIEELSIRGFAVLPDVLTPGETAGTNAALDEIYARQCAEVGGEQELQRLNDADIVRCPLAYDDLFLGLATHPRILEVARAVLGENVVLLMQNGVINRPDRPQFQTNWHRDLNYQHWVSTRPLAVSALVALEDFAAGTGGTAFLPGSHRFEPFPSPSLVAKGEVTPVAPAGSVIFFDSMVFHRAGRNRSELARRAVNHVIGMPILAQQVDIPAALGRAEPEDPRLAGYLGYRWNPVPDVAAWRRRKLAKLDTLVGAQPNPVAPGAAGS
jgi:ectoine hydroxylase-related dioxygenase (phytanoyl-CoA dioxygenase family)